jgi:ribosomal protein S18 acetylase RimI-like enzyme
MSITTRPVAEGDFFAWLGLYEGYAAFYEATLTDERAVLIWSWLIDPKHEENALVAVDDDETLVGLAHYREFPRPLEGDRGLYIDDLFVADAARDQGAGSALVAAVRSIAEERKFGVVQWITAEDNKKAKQLYEELGTRTSWVTYEIAL